MRASAPHVRVLIAVAAGALLASGCASAAPTSTAGSPPGPSSSSPSSGPSSSSPSSGPSSVAAADAAALLASFTPPPGATASAGRPGGIPSGLNAPSMGQVSSDQVVRTGWWTVAASADSTVGWLESHVPHGATLRGTGNDSTWREVDYDEPSTSVLFSRSIVASVVPLPGNRSVLQVDVVEIYRPVKPAAEVVPVTRRLNVSVVPGGNSKIRATATTVTDRATIAKVAAIVNALPTLPDEAISCPADTGSAIDLVFWNGGEGAMLASVRLPLSGCRFQVSVTVGKNRQPMLDGSTSTSSDGVARQVASLLGLPISPTVF